MWRTTPLSRSPEQLVMKVRRQQYGRCILGL